MSQRRFPHHLSKHDPTSLINNTLYWFQAFSINTEAEKQTEFLTPLGTQILDFIKPFLLNFYSGRIIQPKAPNQQATKSNFNDLLQHMASQQPQFLTDFIHQNLTNINNTNISPNYLLFIFRDILSNFTTVLFTKLNYKKIFHSNYFLPPYSIPKRSQIAINLARLHLFLLNQYKTINYIKFFEDLDLKPIRMSLHFNTIFNNSDQLLLKIKNDAKYNIYITFDISSQNFLKTFYIPSFKTYCTTFDIWFAKFFNSYKKQFLHINQQKVYNFIKHQIITYLSNELKKLLPNSYQFPMVNSLQERTKASIKASLYHIYTCTSNTCTILPNNISHTFKNLTSFYFKNSFKPHIYLYLNFAIFQPNQSLTATFSKPFPFEPLKKLANSA